MVWGPIAATVGGAVLGSVISGEANKRAARRSANAANRIAEANDAAQREFAKMGIQWKAEDAAAAGIHPLYALNANTATYSPAQYYGDPVGQARADYMHDMGQNVSRAVAASADQFGRDTVFRNLEIKKRNLENAILEKQLTQMSTPQVGPPFPSSGNFMPGQGNTPQVEVINQPLERILSAKDRPAQEVGWRPDVAYARTDRGLVPVIPESLSESMEDDFIGKVMWRLRNQLAPNLGLGGKPAKSMLPRWANDWRWSHMRQQWEPVWRGKRQ